MQDIPPKSDPFCKIKKDKIYYTDEKGIMPQLTYLDRMVSSDTWSLRRQDNEIGLNIARRIKKFCLSIKPKFKVRRKREAAENRVISPKSPSLSEELFEASTMEMSSADDKL